MRREPNDLVSVLALGWPTGGIHFDVGLHASSRDETHARLQQIEHGYEDHGATWELNGRLDNRPTRRASSYQECPSANTQRAREGLGTRARLLIHEHDQRRRFRDGVPGRERPIDLPVTAIPHLHHDTIIQKQVQEPRDLIEERSIRPAEIEDQTGDRAVASRCAERLLHNLLAAMKIAPELHVDDRLVDQRRRRSFGGAVAGGQSSNRRKRYSSPSTSTILRSSPLRCNREPGVGCGRCPGGRRRADESSMEAAPRRRRRPSSPHRTVVVPPRAPRRRARRSPDGGRRAHPRSTARAGHLRT